MPQHHADGAHDKSHRASPRRVVHNEF